MRYSASSFRFCNILPSQLIETVIRAGRKFSGIVFREGFDKDPNWYKFEEYVDVLFDEESEDDARELIGETCGSCGMCCENIPAHQIGIYMSPTEELLAREAGHNPIFQGKVKSDGIEFGVMGVKPNGDCIMLKEDGCSLGDLKPLWCRIYHCEVYQGKPYQFEQLHRTPMDEILNEEQK